MKKDIQAKIFLESLPNDKSHIEVMGNNKNLVNLLVNAILESEILHELIEESLKISHAIIEEEESKGTVSKKEVN